MLPYGCLILNKRSHNYALMKDIISYHFEYTERAAYKKKIKGNSDMQGMIRRQPA